VHRLKSGRAIINLLLFSSVSNFKSKGSRKKKKEKKKEESNLKLIRTDGLRTIVLHSLPPVAVQ